VDPRLPVDAAWYEAGGLDWRPFLQQLISSELDVDRMDYLARDSHFTGVHYGVFDVGWLMNSLATHVVEGQVFLALQERAIYAFDDFLIARYHMFLMVYFHSRSVAYEEMLKQHFSSDEGGYSIPSEVELFAGVDDLQLLQHLRGSQDEWARRIVDRREYKLLIERHGSHERVDLSGVLERLQAAGIPTLTAASRGVLSKYFDRRRDTPAQETLPLNGEARDNLAPTWPIWVLRQPYRGSSDRRASELEHSTDLFDRYAGQLRMRRIYVPPERVEESGRLIADIA